MKVWLPRDDGREEICYTSFSMKYGVIAVLAVMSLGLFVRPALAFNPNFVIADEELMDPFAMDLNQIQAFLERGYLAEYRAPDHEGTIRSAAEIIWRASIEHGINPKFLLVLIQKEQSLVEDDQPTQKQLDWAAGYAICDWCSMNDPALTRWQGFGKQVNSAAMQFVEGYMHDIAVKGVAAGRYGPGVPVTIDGTSVTPSNAATAALYAYTPHLHGNQNFVTIWDRWFSREYPSGTLVQAYGENGVWLIQGGYRRPITSASALQSRFNSSLIVSVSPNTLTDFPIGNAISFPNYSLLLDESGKISLLVDDALRHIQSMEVFRSIGFSEDELVPVSSADLAGYEEGEPISKLDEQPVGKLLQLSTSGAVYYVIDGIRHAIVDSAILKARFPSSRLTQVDPVEVEQYAEGSPLLLPDGFLVRSFEEPAVYVVSEGKLRPILSGSIFESYGYDWNDVGFISQDALDLQPVGKPLGEGDL